METGFQLKSRLKAAGIHLLVSMAVAASVAALVFGLWFPGAYRDLGGGTHLLTLVVVVDVVMGPLLTFAVFNQRKTASHLRKDIAVIAALQLAALLYGLYSVQLARPVALVFEHDRFRVISAAEVLEKELPNALPEFQSLSWTGPKVIAVRRTLAGQERNDSLMTAIIDGVDTSQRPAFWIPYGAEERTTALRVSRPIEDLIAHYPDDRGALVAELKAAHLKPEDARFLPVIGKEDAVAILDGEGRVAAFFLRDGFF